MSREFNKWFKWKVQRYGIEEIEIAGGYILCDGVDTAKSSIKFGDSDIWPDWMQGKMHYEEYEDSKVRDRFRDCWVKQGLYRGKTSVLTIWECESSETIWECSKNEI